MSCELHKIIIEQNDVNFRIIEYLSPNKKFPNLLTIDLFSLSFRTKFIVNRIARKFDCFRLNNIINGG